MHTLRQWFSQAIFVQHCRTNKNNVAQIKCQKKFLRTCYFSWYFTFYNCSNKTSVHSLLTNIYFKMNDPVYVKYIHIKQLPIPTITIKWIDRLILPGTHNFFCIFLKSYTSKRQPLCVCVCLYVHKQKRLFTKINPVKASLICLAFSSESKFGIKTVDLALILHGFNTNIFYKYWNSNNKRGWRFFHSEQFICVYTWLARFIV